MKITMKYYNAIQALCPGAEFGILNDDITTLEWISKDIPQPTVDEIEAKVVELDQLYQDTQYQRDRAIEYPSIADQLDMLYHDIKTGSLDSGAWIQAIESVKQEFPKP